MIESSEKLIANTELAVKEWNLGPMDVDQPNNEYWSKLSKIWNIQPEEARRNICANCEYYDNMPDTLKEMEGIPLNQYDIYNSQAQRGYCHKLHILCHTPRSCQAWEAKEYEVPVEEVPRKDPAAILYGED